MRLSPGRGAAFGLLIGMALVFLLILLPRIAQQDFYEITDPFLAMGLPMLVVATCVGTLAGVAGSRPAGPGRDGASAEARSSRMPAIVVVAVAGLVAAGWFFLWATSTL